jgi:hypothetical protein
MGAGAEAYESWQSFVPMTGRAWVQRGARRSCWGLSSKWTSSGDWTAKRREFLAEVHQFRGAGEKIFSLTAVRRQTRQAEESEA